MTGYRPREGGSVRTGGNVDWGTDTRKPTTTAQTTHLPTRKANWLRLVRTCRSESDWQLVDCQRIRS